MMYVITKRKERQCVECPFFKAYTLKNGNVNMGCMARTPKESAISPRVCPLK